MLIIVVLFVAKMTAPWGKSLFVLEACVTLVYQPVAYSTDLRDKEF